jgi:hypothetical protein
VRANAADDDADSEDPLSNRSGMSVALPMTMVRSGLPPNPQSSKEFGDACAPKPATDVNPNSGSGSDLHRVRRGLRAREYACREGFEDPRTDPNGPEGNGQAVTINGDSRLDLHLIRR